jgi:hypothetical protein
VSNPPNRWIGYEFDEYPVEPDWIASKIIELEPDQNLTVTRETLDSIPPGGALVIYRPRSGSAPRP